MSRSQKMAIQPQCTRAVPSAKLSAHEPVSRPSTRRVFRRPPEKVTTGPYATTYELPHRVRTSSSREDSGSRTNTETWYVAHPDIAMQRPPQLATTASNSCTDGPKATTRVRKNSAELDMPPRLTRQRTGDTPLLMLATPPPVQRTGLSKDMGSVSVTPPTATGVDTRSCSELEARGPVAVPELEATQATPDPVPSPQADQPLPNFPDMLTNQAAIQAVASKLPMRARAAAARAAAGRTAASLEAAAGRAAAGEKRISHRPVLASG